MTRPARLALTLLVASGLGVLGLSLWGPREGGLAALLTLVLRHGFEGALVGGICDFIAIRQVYRKAEENFTVMVGGVSKTIVEDMIRLRPLIEESLDIPSWLSLPENREWLSEQLNGLYPTREALEAQLTVLWDEAVHEQVVRWLLKGNPKGFFLGAATEKGLWAEPEIRQSFALCLEQLSQEQVLAQHLVDRLQEVCAQITLVDLGVPTRESEMKELAQRLWAHWRVLAGASRLRDFLAEQVIKFLVPALAARVETTTLSDILAPALEEQTVREAMRRFSHRVREVEDAEVPDALVASLTAYGEAYIDAWLAQSEDERRSAIEAVIRNARPLLFRVTVDFLWQLRTALLEPAQLVTNPVIDDLVTRFARQAAERAPEIEQQASGKLSERLSALGPSGFTHMLRGATQVHLDMIKVNGTIWGFFIGAGVGLAGLLFTWWAG